MTLSFQWSLISLLDITNKTFLVREIIFLRWLRKLRFRKISILIIHPRNRSSKASNCYIDCYIFATFWKLELLKSFIINRFRWCGGERGIRTLEGLLTLTRFPSVRIRPLCHLSYSTELTILFKEWLSWSRCVSLIQQF